MKRSRFREIFDGAPCRTPWPSADGSLRAGGVHLSKGSRLNGFRLLKRPLTAWSACCCLW